MTQFCFIGLYVLPLKTFFTFRSWIAAGFKEGKNKDEYKKWKSLSFYSDF